MNLSVAAQAFLIELGTGSDGIDSHLAVKMVTEWGIEPEEVFLEVSRMNLVMSLHEPDGQELICLTAKGLRYLHDISERILGHAWFRNNL
jgi:hypothetical protein